VPCGDHGGFCVSGKTGAADHLNMTAAGAVTQSDTAKNTFKNGWTSKVTSTESDAATELANFVKFANQVPPCNEVALLR
jgi:hypothetical protein